MKMRIITACKNSQGEPDFAAVDVNVTKKEHELGIHYDKARELFLRDGLEDPMVLFDPEDLDILCWGQISNAMRETFKAK